MTRTCGTCGNCLRANPDGYDPFFVRDAWLLATLRGRVGVCVMEEDEAAIVELAMRPEDVPCDFWRPSSPANKRRTNDHQLW